MTKLMGDKRVIWVLGFLVVGIAISIPRASAQILYGSLVGTVTDPSGAAVPQATVRIVSEETGAARVAETNSRGGYSFPSVPAGMYDVTVAKQGFRKYTFTAVKVQIDQVARVDAALQLGAVSQTVEVKSTTPQLQTDSAQVRTEINSESIHNLPVPIDSNYESLLITVPGITPPDNSFSYSANPSRGLQYQANGTTANSNDVRIDGVSANNLWLPMVTSYVPSRAAIQTVSVVTNSFDVSQGVVGGAAVNVHMKSGTNQVHGELYGSDINSALAARPFGFNATQIRNNQRKPKLIDNDLGGTVGGPIVKNKLFYFGSYEGNFLRELGERTVTVPTAAMMNGDFSALANKIFDPATGDTADCLPGGIPKLCGTGRAQFFATSDPSRPDYNAACTSASPGYSNGNCPNIIPTARLDPMGRNIQKLLLPSGGPNLPGFTNNYFATGDFDSTRHIIDSKVDWQVDPKLRVSGHLGILHYRMFNPPVFGNNGLPVSTVGYRSENGFGNVYNTTFSGTYLASSNFVIDGYFGFNLMGTNSEPANLNVNEGLQALNLPGTNGPTRDYGGWPAFLISGFSEVGSGGNSNTDVIRYYDHTYNWTAGANWIKGSHTVKFGGTVVRAGFNHFEEANASGTFNFSNNVTALNCSNLPKGTACPATGQANAYASFLLGLPSSVNKDFVPFNNGRVIAHMWQYTAYVQDQWQARPHLTLNYGVSWNYFPVATRNGGRGLSRYDFSTNQVRICGVAGNPMNCSYNISKANFSPAVGIAYRATQTFVIRAGAGFTYDPEPLAYIRDMFGDYPESLSLGVTNPISGFAPEGILSTGIPAIAVPDISSGVIPLPKQFGFTDLTQNYKRDYVESWNFTLQKELPWGWVGQAGYVATRQVRVPGILNLNVGQVGGGTASEPFNVLYGNTNGLNVETPVNHIHYDSLQVRLDHNFSSGYQIGVAYTLSKSVGDCCNNLADGGPAITLPQYFFLNHSLEPWDRTHDVVVSMVAELPFGQGKHWLNSGGWGSKLAGGWQTNAIASIYSGTPFNITASGTSLNAPGNAQRADLLGSGPVNILGNAGPGQDYFDISRFAPVTQARFGTAGFGIVRGPGAANLDFALFRNFRITERLRLKLQAEAFNLTNTPHFSNPSANVSSGGFGQITSVHGTGREGIDQRFLELGATVSF